MAQGPQTRNGAPVRTPSGRASARSSRTRGLILGAAERLFAAKGFEGTTIRDVAAEAGIDPALVMRYFGSKDELFVQASAIEINLPALEQLPKATVGEALIRHFLSIWEGPQARNGMAVLLRSAATNEMSAAKMRATFAAQVLPAIGKVGSRASTPRRAALVASQLLGLALCRYILKVPPIAEMPAAELIRYIAPTLQRYALGIK